MPDRITSNRSLPSTKLSSQRPTQTEDHRPFFPPVNSSRYVGYRRPPPRRERMPHARVCQRSAQHALLVGWPRPTRIGGNAVDKLDTKPSTRSTCVLLTPSLCAARAAPLAPTPRPAGSEMKPTHATLVAALLCAFALTSLRKSLAAMLCLHARGCCACMQETLHATTGAPRTAPTPPARHAHA